MEEEQIALPEAPKDPMPLSSDAVKIDIDTKPKVADKATNVVRRRGDFLQNIINTPKESGSSDSTSTSSNSTSSQSSSTKNSDTQSILAKLDSEEPKSSSGSDNGPPPTQGESDDTAGMMIDAFDAIFTFIAQLWAKDSDDREYKAETENKKKLKKYLSEILQRAQKKYPVAWLFAGLVLVCYFPMAKKAHDHRKLVNEQRAKNSPNAPITGEVKRRRRRGSFSVNSNINNNGGDDGFTPVEVIK